MFTSKSETKNKAAAQNGANPKRAEKMSLKMELGRGKGGSGGKAAIKKQKLPQKTSMNLLVQETMGASSKTSIIAFVIFIILLAVFVKFGVVNQITKANKAENAYETMNTAGNAGLFRTISSKKMTVSNLMLKNFQVSGTTGAGALAGSVKAITAEEANGAEPVVNVLNVGVSLTSGTSASDTADSRYASGSYTIKASAGSAGGLIGSSGRETHIVNSFASVPVRATVSAGGLIGEITTGGTEDSTIKNSYSGGRTVSGKYDTAAYNVTSTTGSAGGLIGTITAPTDFTSDYSTCSVSASAYGGGFIGIGTASGTSFVS